VKYIITIIKADYLQRTRSYGFLIVLAIAVYGAYSFVPPPSANYTTLTMPGYLGVYNSAWVGYISAMMTTIMVSLWGYFLINSGIKKDIDTEVGLIIATTPLTNLGYLLSKLLSNFLVLLTITGITFIISIAMFFLRTDGYPFILGDFVLPYLLFAIPALFFVSALAVTGEVFLKKNQILQCIAFVFLFGMVIGTEQQMKDNTVSILLDTFGVKTMTGSIANTVNARYHAGVPGISIGFTFHSHKQLFQTFVWNGIVWTNVFLFSRLLWICLAFVLVYVSSFFFHRFDLKEVTRHKRRKVIVTDRVSDASPGPVNISLSGLPKLVPDYGIMPFIKTELLLMIRKGPKWFWVVIAGLWGSMIFMPLAYAWSIALPIIWFFQVTRWSELATKEKTYRLHYFTYSSYKPLERMLPAQMLAGSILALALALPVIIRCGIAFNFYGVVDILDGAVFVVSLAVCLGIVSGGKKLFEILFFLITYVLIDKGPIADYMGALPHGNQMNYLITILVLNMLLITTSFALRKYQVRNL
jgi:hypothetical protein